MDKGFMAKDTKGNTSSVYPTHEDAALAFGATLRNGTKFTTSAVKKGPGTGALWVTDYHSTLPRAWQVKQGTAVAL